jgi:hypothetical protein
LSDKSAAVRSPEWHVSSKSQVLCSLES